jgi:hypothetical protein
MLNIEGDPAMCHVFEFGKSKHPCYSDQALAIMKEQWSRPEVQDRLRAELKRKMATAGQNRRQRNSIAVKL